LVGGGKTKEWIKGIDDDYINTDGIVVITHGKPTRVTVRGVGNYLVSKKEVIK
jgi:hypothetical protein